VADQLSLTLPQFVRRLNGIDRLQPVGMITVTVPKMKKRSNPFFGRVLKISYITAFINCRYSRTVNLQRVREAQPANFRARERAWGSKLEKRPLVEHDDQYYFEVKLQARKSQLRLTETGEVIPPETIKPFIAPLKKNPRQRLNREVILRDFRVDHVAELRINGEVWRVRRPWNQLQKLLAKGEAA
jgi:hypothetical protein